ncbi:hypothetical protein [Propioniciclava sinopodophylli]|uniref:hypothetical protein n=1 Tax=Propioniciclava sinopodophylli TaxID=1837344 RepID=UPI002491FC59|nr:hypothetical protein [Propioniciclava sinopodophylli]
MRSLVALDSVDLRTLACPWCGRVPQGATFGWKAVRDGAVVGVLAAAPASELGGPYPQGAVVVVQAWVRREDVRELIGTQLVHRAAAALTTRGVSCLVAPGTFGVPDCRHLPGAFLDKLGFTESVAGRQWRIDLRRTLRVPEAVRGVADLVGRLVRPARPAPANRSGRPGS